MKRTLLSVVAALMLVLSVAGPLGVATAPAAPTSPATPASGETDALAAQKESAEVELLIIERRLSSVQRDIAQGQAELERIQSELVSSEALLERASRDLAARQEQLGIRIRDIYKRGRIGRLEVLMESTTLTDFLNRAKALRKVLLQERRLVESIRSVRARAAELSAGYRDTLKTKTARLDDLRDLESDLKQSERRQSEIVAGLGNRLAAVRQAMQQAEQKMSSVNKAANASSSSGASGASRVTARTTQSTMPRTNSTGPGSRQGKTMKVKATAYCDSGYTASGLPCGPGIIATDPRVIPLGTRVYVPGYGEAIAADTGGAVKGAFIDVWLPTYAQAEAWGVKYLTITILD